MCVCECGGIINWIAGPRREQKRASIHTVDGAVAVNEATQQKKKKKKRQVKRGLEGGGRRLVNPISLGQCVPAGKRC